MVSPLGPQPSASASSATSARKPRKYTSVAGDALWRRARSVPGAAALARTHGRRPRLVSWALLGGAMVVMMTLFSWGVGLAFRQWLALAGATLLTAWIAVWIVFQEGDGGDEPAE